MRCALYAIWDPPEDRASVQEHTADRAAGDGDRGRSLCPRRSRGARPLPHSRFPWGTASGCGPIRESSACGAVRGAPSAGRPAGSRTDASRPGGDSGPRLGPELVVVGREEGFPMWVAWHRRSRSGRSSGSTGRAGRLTSDRWAPGTFRHDACLSVVVRQCVHSDEVTKCCELRLRYCAR